MPDDRDMSLDERIARQVVADDFSRAKLIASNMGRPPGTGNVSEARMVALFLEEDPDFDEQAAYAQHLAQGTPPWDAVTDIALRKYPNRLELQKSFGPRVKEQVEGINRLAKRAEAELERRHKEAEKAHQLDPSAFVTAPASPPEAPARAPLPPIEAPY